MNINSTEEERYEELKDRVLSVHQWDDSKALQMTDPKESIAHAVRRYARELEIVGTKVHMEGIEEDVVINASTIKESISSMVKQHADLINLSKLFTVIKQVSESAILIDVEPFRHGNKPQKAKEILADYQYIGSFCDQNNIYPVKITAEQRKTKSDTNVHMTITVEAIKKSNLHELNTQKEELSIPRMHPLQNNGESWDSGRDSSFNVSLLHLVQNFNENQAILIKNLPDQILNEDQQKIKEKLVQFDKEKDTVKRITLYMNQISEALERGEDLAYKVVPREYEIQMKQAMLDSGICFVEFPTELNGAWYKTIAVQQKDKDAFLKVQEDVFKDFSLTRPCKEQAEELDKGNSEVSVGEPEEPEGPEAGD